MANLLQAAVSAAERGATLVRDLLAFARRQPLEPKQVNVAGLIDDALKILNQTIRPEIRLLTRAEPGLWPAWVDPNQLELAILNLALNARDAMPGAGRLQICCENRHVEAQNAPSARAKTRHNGRRICGYRNSRSEVVPASCAEERYRRRASARDTTWSPRRNTEVRLTRCWREPDSNHWSRSCERSIGCCRRAMPDPVSWMVCH